jgi:hypothetical protein
MSLGARAFHLNDLDDACLLSILSQLDPLPDLFNIAASCRVRLEAGPIPRLALAIHPA